MLQQVQYGTTTIEYNLTFGQRKTLAIDVHPNLSITVTAPTGSTTTDVAAAGKILLNLRLVLAPKQFIDYVVMHELCHLKEHNHRSVFTRMAGRIDPGN